MGTEKEPCEIRPFWLATKVTRPERAARECQRWECHSFTNYMHGYEVLLGWFVPITELLQLCGIKFKVIAAQSPQLIWFNFIIITITDINSTYASNRVVSPHWKPAPDRLTHPVSCTRHSTLEWGLASSVPFSASLWQSSHSGPAPETKSTIVHCSKTERELPKQPTRAFRTF